MKVAVIGGGGAGLAAAWLLEETHDVTLFEQSDRLGGHLETLELEVDGKRRTVDAGVHFFSEGLQPTFVRMLRQIGAPLAPYDPTATFFDRRDGFVVHLPPFGSLARLSTLVNPRAMRTLGALRTLIDQAIDLVEHGGDFAITVEEFVERLHLPGELCREFLYPYLASYWGVLPDEVRAYSARNALCYLVRHRPPLIRPRPSMRMIGGMKAYVERMVSSLSRTRIERGSSIASIERRGAKWILGAAWPEFDQVVIATNATQAAAILRDQPDDVARLLRKIEYSETTIAVHGDTSLMPRDRSSWSNVNAIFDGRSCALTSWEIENRGVDLFRSWTTHAERAPERCHATIKYLHPRPNPAYFAAQLALESHQGRDGLWLAGMYAAGYDNHEGALASAQRVAATLAPNAARARSLLA